MTSLQVYGYVVAPVFYKISQSLILIDFGVGNPIVLLQYKQRCCLKVQ